MMTLTKPKTCPWGQIQHREELLPGIIFVSTASHGGVWLTPERARAMPRELRVNQHGNYFEEDCEIGLVALAFLDEWVREGVGTREQAIETVRNWFPDTYEQYTGETLQPGESLKKDEQAFKESAQSQWVVVSAMGDWHEDCPKGMVLGVATLGRNRCPGQKKRRFLIPKDEYRIGKFGFIVDPSRYQEL